jgi:hypothetical protein
MLLLFTVQVPARAVHLDGLAYPKSMSLRALMDFFGSSSSSSSTGSRHLLGSIASISSSGDADGSTADADSGTEATAAAAGATGTQAASSDSKLDSSSSSNSSNKKQPLLVSRLLPARLAEGVDILKVDVEGREPDVFATAGKLLESGKVANIIMEYSPGYYYQVTERL